MKRTVSILGSTGSIGTATVDLIKQHPQSFEVRVLVGGANVELLARQARELGARHAVINDESKLPILRDLLKDTDTQCGGGRAAVCEAAAIPVDWTMAAIMGAAGLEPTLAAIKNGKDVALANKESLVCAGSIMLDAVKKAGARLLPVDSEHNAIVQSLGSSKMEEVDHIVLTASGGPFRTFDLEAMKNVTPEMALKHPTWTMGRKITIDSASMANKGLEVIEAARLFNLPNDRIKVLIHPQSLVHGMVAFRDGSIVSQMGAADMRIPIAHALGDPLRLHTNSERLNLANAGTLEFFEMDETRFKPLALARRSLEMGGGASAIFSAANEIAVDAFLERRLSFLGIGDLIERVLDGVRDNADPKTIEDVLAFDAYGRRAAIETLAQGSVR